MIKVFLFSLLMTWFAKEGYTQNEIGKEQIIQELRTLRNKLNTISSTDPSVQEKVRSCRTIINDAILNIDARNESFPLSYLNSLKALTELSTTIQISDRLGQQKKLAILEKDLALKFSYLPDQISTTSYVKEVPVNVSTKNATAAVNNLRVHYNLLGYATDFTKQNYIFKKVTSPVTESLVPGYYVIWATRDGDTKVLGKITIEVDPSKKNDFDIPVK